MLLQPLAVSSKLTAFTDLPVSIQKLKTNIIGCARINYFESNFMQERRTRNIRLLKMLKNLLLQVFSPCIVCQF